MGDPFPLHQLLHCVGMDYWSDWVTFVSPRVFLFHRLFPPETGKEKKKNHISCLSLHLLLPLDRNWLHREHTACLIALLGKDTDTSKFLLQTAGTGPWNTVQEHHCHSLHTWAKGCQHQMGRCLSPVTTDSGQQELIPKGPLPAHQQFPSLCHLSGDTKSASATIQFGNEVQFVPS